MLPEAATTAMPLGEHTVAALADPPSPVLMACPSPATVEMMPTANIIQSEAAIEEYYQTEELFLKLRKHVVVG